eukprot:TRINITY_DN19103_c0_g1_i1.p1 TRINITY_DN19103_c0_g1~~TRINITY_DN19103_c0_g1_i1.p1  ORF type:complete len:211 (-),score=43.09 TRINITY_DN19103_c0_g1_i1:46-678(-)
MLCACGFSCGTRSAFEKHAARFAEQADEHYALDKQEVKRRQEEERKRQEFEEKEEAMRLADEKERKREALEEQFQVERRMVAAMVMPRKAELAALSLYNKRKSIPASFCGNAAGRELLIGREPRQQIGTEEWDVSSRMTASEFLRRCASSGSLSKRDGGPVAAFRFDASPSSSAANNVAASRPSSSASTRQLVRFPSTASAVRRGRATTS